MRIGLSTYAYFWRASSNVSHPMSVDAMLEDCAALGGNVFQICDYKALERLSSQRLRDIASHARSLNIDIELGTRGIGTAHLSQYLKYCDLLDARLLRSMINGPDHSPSIGESISLLHNILPSLTSSQVSLALETYEQIPSHQLLEVINTIDSPLIGICLDPANCVAGYENPNNVIKACASRTINLHVKDFRFTRRDGWVGFNFSGEKMGNGDLDYEYLFNQVEPTYRGINQIVEHWLPWQNDERETCRIEAEWTRQSIEFLLSYSAAK